MQVWDAGDRGIQEVWDAGLGYKIYEMQEVWDTGYMGYRKGGMQVWDADLGHRRVGMRERGDTGYIGYRKFGMQEVWDTEEAGMDIWDTGYMGYRRFGIQEIWDTDAAMTIPRFPGLCLCVRLCWSSPWAVLSWAVTALLTCAPSSLCRNKSTSRGDPGWSQRLPAELSLPWEPLNSLFSLEKGQ